MMESVIRIKNADNVILKGVYSKINKKDCCIYFHGFAGCYDSLAKSVHEKLKQNKISFLFGYTQGYGIIYPMKKEINGLAQEINCGGCYEYLDNYSCDYDAWFNFLKEEKYENIYVITHSLACNKIIDYLNKNKVNNIKKIFMLAPQDLTQIIYQYPLNINKALENLKSNKSEEILPEKFLGFCDICSRTFLSFSSECKLHNIQYKNSNFKFEKLNNIKIPIFAIIGQKDEGLKQYNAKECMEFVKKNVPLFDYKIIKNAKHTFKNNLDELNNIIINKIIRRV